MFNVFGFFDSMVEAQETYVRTRAGMRDGDLDLFNL